MYVCIDAFDNRGEKVKIQKKKLYNNSKKMFTRRVKLFRIIGDADNQRTDE